MRPDEFSPTSPGKLLPIIGGHAFLPDAVPPRLASSWTLAHKLETATSALASLTGHARAAGNYQLLARALVAREAVESNRIEGTHTQILDVIKQDVVGPPPDPKRAANQLEVIRSWQAADEGATWLTEGRPLSAYLIRALHETLLRGTRGADKHPGSFRSTQVFIGRDGDDAASATFVPPPPEFVAERVQQLAEFMVADVTYPVLVAAAISHYQFEAIHPFEDGNGRLGRVLVTLMLLARQAIELPLLFVSPYFSEHDNRYRSLLKRVSTEGAWEEWITFFLDAVAFQANDGLMRARRMIDLRERYQQMVVGETSSQAALRAVDLVMERAVVTVSQVSAFAGSSALTARTVLRRLEALGIVTSLDTYPAAWAAHEVLAQVYGDTGLTGGVDRQP